jgi:hypothetical protein
MHTLRLVRLAVYRERQESEKPAKFTFYRLFKLFELLLSGPDGTRTRDLRRDRAAF